MREMTCRDFDEVVHGFVRMELLDVNVREAALEHAAHCEACAQRMSDAAILAEVSETMSRSALDSETPSHVEAAVSAAFQSHHRRAAWRRRFEWVTVGAAAAVLLIGLWTMRGRSKEQPYMAPKKDVASQSTQPVEAKVSTSAQGNPTGTATDDSATLAASDTFVAADFVPVPYTAGVSTDDPGMIVRVQLTRASLAQLGYPVAETPDEDLILADVLVGEDGWPRGVKIVQ